MYTVFVATDFSKASENAARYAVSLAQKINANIILFHECTHSGKYEKTDFEKSELKDCERKLNLQCKNISEEYKLSCRIVISHKSGTKELIREAEKNGADMIVMGITDAPRAEKTILGSMTQTLIKSAKIPIMAIPEKVKFNSITKIVLAIGKIVPDLNSLKTLAGFASAFNAHIEVAHVVEDKGKSTFSHVEATELIKKVGYVNISFITLPGNNIANTFDEYLKTGKASMLVIMRKNISYLHDIFSGLAGKMTYTSNVPLLVFNEGEFNIGPLELIAEEILG